MGPNVAEIQPRASQKVEGQQTALRALQSRMQEFSKVWRDDDCGGRGFMGCDGRCQFVYSAMTCVPRYLYKEAESDPLRMIMYIIMHSPRMGAALERLAGVMDQAKSRDKKSELHKYAKRMFGKATWDAFLRGDTEAMATAIIEKSKNSSFEAMKLAVFVSVAAAVITSMSMLIVPTLLVLLGWMILQVSALLTTLTSMLSTVVASASTFIGKQAFWWLLTWTPWVAVLVGGMVGSMMLLELFAPSIEAPLRTVRDHIGTWLSEFTVSMNRAQLEGDMVPTSMSATEFAQSTTSRMWKYMTNSFKWTIGKMWGSSHAETEAETKPTSWAAYATEWEKFKHDNNDYTYDKDPSEVIDMLLEQYPTVYKDVKFIVAPPPPPELVPIADDDKRIFIPYEEAKAAGKSITQMCSVEGQIMYGPRQKVLVKEEPVEAEAVEEELVEEEAVEEELVEEEAVEEEPIIAKTQTPRRSPRRRR